MEREGLENRASSAEGRDLELSDVQSDLFILTVRGGNACKIRVGLTVDPEAVIEYLNELASENTCTWQVFCKNKKSQEQLKRAMVLLKSRWSLERLTLSAELFANYLKMFPPAKIKQQISMNTVTQLGRLSEELAIPLKKKTSKISWL